jgi:hypothetical protein
VCVLFLVKNLDDPQEVNSIIRRKANVKSFIFYLIVSIFRLEEIKLLIYYNKNALLLKLNKMASFDLLNLCKAESHKLNGSKD